MVIYIIGYKYHVFGRIYLQGEVSYYKHTMTKNYQC